MDWEQYWKKVLAAGLLTAVGFTEMHEVKLLDHAETGFQEGNNVSRFRGTINFATTTATSTSANNSPNSIVVTPWDTWRIR